MQQISESALQSQRFSQQCLLKQIACLMAKEIGYSHMPLEVRLLLLGLIGCRFGETHIFSEYDHHHLT